MPQAPLTAAGLLTALSELGITHLVWLPDSESGFLYQALREFPSLTLVPVAREGESIAIAAGLLAGGERPAVVMQSTGFYESGDSLRGMAIDYHLPLLLVIGYRGYVASGDIADSAARYLEPILRTWEVPYHLLMSDDDLLKVRRAWVEAQERRGPVAVLLGLEYQA